MPARFIKLGNNMNPTYKLLTIDLKIYARFLKLVARVRFERASASGGYEPNFSNLLSIT